MGHDPAGVDRVAGEAPAELVVDAAATHRVHGPAGGLDRGGVAGAFGVPDQRVEKSRGREFGCAAETAVLTVLLVQHRADTVCQQPVVDRNGSRG
ncbi:hypothetical protein MTX80_21100 [Gordonia amicalis]|nr:hypothetical protein [Gordonia amicalis]UOG23645.1 hypothetical protein MTX80_21100 [Gordonia amicalis]